MEPGSAPAAPGRLRGVGVGHTGPVECGGFEPAWQPAAVDAAALWAASGASWLTDPRAGTPATLVHEVAGLARFLDARGAGLADLVPAEGVGLLAERSAMLRFGPAGTASSGGGSRLVRAADGWIAVTLARDDDLDLVPAWLEVGRTDDTCLDHWKLVDDVVARRDVSTLVERAALLGLPVSSVGEVTDARAVLAEHCGDAPPMSLDGMVVVNLGSLWAAPLCGDLLARCGARLVTVESTARPDGARRRPDFFEALHGRSESVALDLRTRSGQVALAQLLRRADIVIEASRPRALGQMGISSRDLVSAGPRLWLSITAYGHGSPTRVGFGDDAAAAGGLVATVDGEPRFVADAVADPLTGLVAAATAAQLVESGGRWFVDIALARVARSMAGSWVSTTARPLSMRPVPRTDPGAPMPLGRDNATWLDPS